MVKLGLSIYPNNSKILEMKKYLEMGEKYGFTHLFASFLEVESDDQDTIKKYFQIFEYAKKLQYNILLDVDPDLMNRYNVKFDDLSFFETLGVDGIRMDLSIDSAKEAFMTRNRLGLTIDINASEGTTHLENILNYSPNKKKLTATHNYYPQRFSGIGVQYFQKTTNHFKENGIETAVFLNSRYGQIGPCLIPDGLCTLEEHRELSMSTQMKHIIMMENIDTIYIANSFADEKEMKVIRKINDYQFPTLKVKLKEGISDLEKEIIFSTNHGYRGDVSEYIIRSTMTRIKFKDKSITPSYTVNIKKGDVIIPNDKFNQYKGEMQIALKEFQNDGRLNVVGKVVEEEVFLIDYLKPWSRFEMIENKGE